MNPLIYLGLIRPLPQGTGATIGNQIIVNAGMYVYPSTAHLRTNEDHVDGFAYCCLIESFLHIYRFVALSVAVDDGASIIKPNDIDSGDPGRYIQVL